MLDEYTRCRFDRMAENVAVTRNKVEAIERHFCRLRGESEAQERRLGKLERKVAALWIVGPALVGLAALLANLKTWFLER